MCQSVHIVAPMVVIETELGDESDEDERHLGCEECSNNDQHHVGQVLNVHVNFVVLLAVPYFVGLPHICRSRGPH